MKIRAIILVAMMSASLMVASGLAYAAAISCPNRSANLCVGTAQADTMTGRNVADILQAKGGNDTLKARGANDKLTGGPGKDILNGAQGSDTYLFADGWGQDSINSEGDGVDTLDFSALSARLRVDLVPTAGQPEARSGTNTLEIPNTATVIEKVRGGANGDQIFGNSANNTFSGNGNFDVLYGGSGKDALFGGAGGDVFQGDGGDDSLNGGGDSDSYRYFGFDGAFGQDTITDSPIPSDTDRFTGNEISLTNFSDNLTINLVADANQPEVNGTSLGSINWSGNVIDNVDNQDSGNDTVNGNSAANAINSFYGKDVVRGGEGDDFINVADQQEGDQVYCGEGNDTVVYDIGDGISLDCEN